MPLRLPPLTSRNAKLLGCGVSFLLAAAALWLTLQTNQLYSQTSQTLSSISTLNAESGNPPTPAPSASKADKIGELRDSLPPPDILTEVLAFADAIASKAGVLIQTGDYQLIEGDRLNRYVLSLPAKGPYPAVQGLIGALLDEYPNLALERMTIIRSNTSENVVEASLTFALFFRPDTKR